MDHSSYTSGLPNRTIFRNFIWQEVRLDIHVISCWRPWKVFVSLNALRMIPHGEERATSLLFSALASVLYRINCFFSNSFDWDSSSSQACLRVFIFPIGLISICSQKMISWGEREEAGCCFQGEQCLWDVEGSESSSWISFSQCSF